MEVCIERKPALSRDKIAVIILVLAAILAVAFMFIAALSLATGFILDAVAKVERKQWELQVYRQAENE